MKKFFSGILLILIFAVQSWAIEIDIDANNAVDIANGGTNGITPAAARVNLGLEIGVNVLAEQTIGIINDNLLEVDGSPNIAEYVRFTANGLEGRTESEFKGDFNLEAGIDFYDIAGTDSAISAAIALLQTDDLVTLSGVAIGSIHLGVFSGSTITDNQTIKAALQLLETAIEGVAGGHDAVTIGTANGLSLSGQILSLAPSTNSTPGAMTIVQVIDLEENNTDIKIVNRIRDENITWTGENIFNDGITVPGASDGGQFAYWLEDTTNGANYAGWGIYGNMAHDTLYMFPLAAPTAGQSMRFAVPGNQTMSGGGTESVSIATWFNALEDIANAIDSTHYTDRSIDSVHINSFTLSPIILAEPDLLQPIDDAWPLYHFLAETYPSGVTIDAIHISTSATCTDVLNFEEWSNNGTAWSTDSTVEAITLSGTHTEDGGTLADASIAADAWLYLDLPATPTNIAYYSITISFHAN